MSFLVCEADWFFPDFIDFTREFSILAIFSPIDLSSFRDFSSIHRNLQTSIGKLIVSNSEPLAM
jgi:hypothetical protein